jgi:hypothetical protein
MPAANGRTFRKRAAKADVRPHRTSVTLRTNQIKTFAVYALAAYGLAWTVVESIGAFFPDVKPEGWKQYGALILLSLAYGLKQARPKRSVELVVPYSDSTVRIEFGDLWTKDGCIAIQVNEFFDSQLGNHVSTNSLHGQFIRDRLRGQPAEFDRLVSLALTGEPFEPVPRTSGNTRRYQIGTTASVDVGPSRYLLFAFSKTDINTLKASATVHELWDALAGLWRAATIYSNGDPVSMPLVGGGLSGVGLPARSLLAILLISFAYHTKKQKITSKLTIVLPKDLATEVDLRELRF